MGWTSTQLTCVLCKNDQKLIKNKFWDVTLFLLDYFLHRKLVTWTILQVNKSFSRSKIRLKTILNLDPGP